MLKFLVKIYYALIILILFPDISSAGGGKVDELIVVADTRMLSGIQLYFANLYNEDIWIFAVWSVVLTTFLGGILGIIMDLIMKFTGIDLTKRSLVEH